MVLSRVFLALVVLLIMAPASFAQTVTDPAKLVPHFVGLGAGIGMGLSVLGIGLGLGVIGYSALAGIARQPEQAGKIQGAMILLAALVEGAGIVSLILCLLIGGRILG
jgi:F-type H+-transporting ATPase subunit c